MWNARDLTLVAVLSAGLAACGAETTGVPKDPPGQPPATPSVDLVLPSSLAAGTTREIRVSGSGFEAGLRIEFTLGSATTPDPRLSATVVSVTSSEVRASLSIAAGIPEAAFNVVAINPTGRQGIGNNLLLVEDTPADELPTPGARGAVLVLLATGEAFGAVSGGCSADDVGLPASWSASGQYSSLPAPSGAGCTFAPLRLVGSALLGRGTPADANERSWPVAWAAQGHGGVQANVVPQPPVGQRFHLGHVGQDGLFLGHATDTTGTGPRRLFPFVWQLSGGWVQVQTVAGSHSCDLSDSRSNGEVIGWCSPNTAPTRPQPVFWAGPNALPVVLPLPAGVTTGFAIGLNSAGVVVGSAGDRAAMWSRDGGDWSVTVLPAPGSSSVAYLINDSGWIAGTIGSNPTRTVLWSPELALRALGRLDLVHVCAPSAITPSAPTTPPLVGGRCFRGDLGMRPVIWRPR